MFFITFVTQLILLSSHCQVHEAEPSPDLMHYVGIAKVDGFFRDEGCGAVPDARVAVYARPSATKKIAEVRWEHSGQNGEYCVPVVFEPHQRCPRGMIPVLEHGYEERGFVALERAGRWARVRLDRGSGWIRTASFVSYETIMIGSLTEMTDAWDGQIYSRPNRAAHRMNREFRDVDVVDARYVKGTLWFEVRVMSSSICTEREPHQIARGWVRGYAADGRPTIHHFSRGC